jgi:hypothetical protein
MTPEDIYEPNYRFTSKPRMNAEQSDWAGVINTTLNEALAGEENAREWFLDNGEEFQFVCALADMNPEQVSEFAKRRLNGVVFSKSRAKPKPVVITLAAPDPLPERVPFEKPTPVVSEKALLAAVAANRARAKRYTFEGKSLSAEEWAAEKGINVRTLRDRLYKGLPIEEVLTPKKPKNEVSEKTRIAAAAARKAQAKRYTFEGKSLTIEEWAVEKALDANRLRSRLNRYGYTIEKALTAPLHLTGSPDHWTKKNAAKVIYEGKEMTIAEAAERAGFTPNTVESRIKRGWKPEKALSTPPRKLNRRKAAPTICKEAQPSSDVASIVVTALSHVRPALQAVKGYYKSAREALKGAMGWRGKECAAKAADESKAQSASMVAHDSEKRTGEPLAERKEAV